MGLALSVACLTESQKRANPQRVVNVADDGDDAAATASDDAKRTEARMRKTAATAALTLKSALAKQKKESDAELRHVQDRHQLEIEQLAAQQDESDNEEVVVASRRSHRPVSVVPVPAVLNGRRARSPSPERVLPRQLAAPPVASPGGQGYSLQHIQAYQLAEESERQRLKLKKAKKEIARLQEQARFTAHFQ